MTETQTDLASTLVQARADYDALRLDESLAGYEAALAAAPDSYDATLGLSRVLSRMRRQAEALAAAERCIALDHQRPEGYCARGQLRFLVDDLDEARDDLLRALELAPDDPEARLSLAQVYADQSRFDEAEAELARAREAIAALEGEGARNRLLGTAWHAQAYLLLARNKNAEAVEAAQEAIALEAANPHAACLAYSNIGILEARSRRYDSAIDYLEHAYTMNRYFHRAGSALGRLLILRNHPQRAAEVLEQVLETMPEENGSTRYAYAMALARSGRRAQALGEYRAALSKGLSTPDALLARWQTVWLSEVGRYAVIGVILAAVLAYVVLAKPSPQTMTFLAILALILVLQRTMGRRRRS